MSDLEDKIKAFNFEALKGTISADPVFQGAVETFRKFAQDNPQGFEALSGTVNAQAEQKRERIGVAGMESKEMLDSILDDINKLPPEERKPYLDQIARPKGRKLKHEIRAENLLEDIRAAVADEQALVRLVTNVLFEGHHHKANAVEFGTAVLESAKPETSREAQAREGTLERLGVKEFPDDRRYYPEDLENLVHSGRLLPDEARKVSKAMQTAQQNFQRTYDQILNALKEGVQELYPPKRRE